MLGSQRPLQISFAGPGGTLVHRRSGSLARNDYLALPMLWRESPVSGHVAPQISAGHSIPDHFAVFAEACVRLQNTRGRTRSGRIDTKALLDPANQDRVHGILQQVPSVPWNVNANDHAAIVVDDLYRRLRAAFPLTARRMSRGYIAEDTALLHQRTAALRHALRWRYHALQMAYIRCAFLAWQGSAQFSSLFQGKWLHSLRCSIAASSLQLHALGKLVRRYCRRDRTAFLTQLAADAESAPPGQVHVAVRKLLRPKKLGGHGPQPLPRLKKPSGELCSTVEEVAGEWRRHFASLEGGQEISPAQLVREGLARQAEWGTQELVAFKDAPSFRELVVALHAVHPHKAAGPDLLPPAICRRFAVPVAAIVWPLLLKGALLSTEPIGFKGGTLHHIPKPSAPDKASASSQRGILVQPVLGKAIHRAFRRLPSTWFEERAAPLQIGGRRGMSYAFGFHMFRNFLRFAQGQGLSAAIIFTDLAAAYYAVVREAVVGASLCDDPIEVVARSLHLSVEDMQALQHHIASEPVVADANSDILTTLLREAHVDTWFHIASDDVVIRTRRGTRPGSCLADVAFNLLFERVLARRGCLPDESVPRIPWTGRKELVQFSTASASIDAVPAVALQDIAYADDHAACVVSDRADGLAQAVRHTMGRSIDSMAGHGLTVNYGPRKTAALMVHRGRGSRIAKDTVFHRGKGKIPVLLEHGGCVQVDVVPSYKHLGSVLTYNGSMLPEIRGRVARAKAAFGEGRKKIFACPCIALHKRVQLCKLHVFSALLAGAGAWPSLCQGSWVLLERCVTTMCRQMLRISATADQHWTRVDILVACDFSSVEDLLAAERLRFLSQLVHSGPDAAWALLQHCPDSANVLLQAGEWLLRAVSATCPYPAFVPHWEEWKALILRRPKLWKGLIRRSLDAWALIDRLARRHWVAIADPVDEVPDSHACLLCKCAFSCAQTWASHAVLKHGYRAPHFRAAVGNRCRACGTIFANVRRHRTHLQVSAACRQSVLRSDPDLLPVWTSTDAHVQSRAIKGRGTSHLPPPGRDLAHELLSGLAGLSVASDEDIFALVQQTVEPFPVLVHTLSCWIAGLPPGALRDAAEDVRLCLRVDLLCDGVAGRRASCDREGLFRPDVRPLAWAPRPAGLPGLVLLGSAAEAGSRLDIQPGGGWRSFCFASPPHVSLDFAGAFLRFPKPPLRAVSLWDLPSCTLRDMRRYLVWLQRRLSWISLALRLASSGRACILDFGQVPFLSGPVRDWLSSTALTPRPALSFCFTRIHLL